MNAADAARRDLALVAERYAHLRADRWSRVPPELDHAIAADRDLATAAFRARAALVRAIEQRLGQLVPPLLAARYADAVLSVPRERFVLPEDIAHAAEDVPMPLDREGHATVSAPHAYLLTYGLLGLDDGDRLLELGTGTGYGAALGHAIVGPRGYVTSIEIDPILHERARRILADMGLAPASGVTLLPGDAHVLAPEILLRAAAEGFRGPVKVAITYAVSGPPAFLIDRLSEGSCLVVPVNRGDGEQDLVRWEVRGGGVQATAHGAVRYVTERH